MNISPTTISIPFELDGPSTNSTNSHLPYTILLAVQIQSFPSVLSWMAHLRTQPRFSPSLHHTTRGSKRRELWENEHFTNSTTISVPFKLDGPSTNSTNSHFPYTILLAVQIESFPSLLSWMAHLRTQPRFSPSLHHTTRGSKRREVWENEHFTNSTTISVPFKLDGPSMNSTEIFTLPTPYLRFKSNNDRRICAEIFLKSCHDNRYSV
ncbi:hypothetical protein AVEN_217249-1 [Araneus ventricosus]|uniref:Uncharacterized protein n=1 Tax=Araneus ventricosus TaxID=182803 RepID=A0A4Y2SGC9_ARAVE|nr:hypothetical protein AVEN_217249-1 [Araneus ventricosus]